MYINQLINSGINDNQRRFKKTYAELMAKMRKGEALTAEEVAEFEKLSRRGPI